MGAGFDAFDELESESTEGEVVVPATEGAEGGWISEGYDMVLGDQGAQRLYFADYIQGASPDSYLEGRGTGLHEDEVVAAGVQYAVGGNGGGNRQQRRHGGGGRGEQTVRAVARPNHAFVEKCRRQILDFSLVVRLPGGQVTTRRFGTDRNGNDEIYVSWLRPENARVRDLVEGWLDRLAGRDTPTQEAFEALLKVR